MEFRIKSSKRAHAESADNFEFKKTIYQTGSLSCQMASLITCPDRLMTSSILGATAFFQRASSTYSTSIRAVTCRSEGKRDPRRTKCKVCQLIWLSLSTRNTAVLIDSSQALITGFPNSTRCILGYSSSDISMCAFGSSLLSWSSRTRSTRRLRQPAFSFTLSKVLILSVATFSMFLLFRVLCIPISNGADPVRWRLIMSSTPRVTTSAWRDVNSGFSPSLKDLNFVGRGSSLGHPIRQGSSAMRALIWASLSFIWRPGRDLAVVEARVVVVWSA
ncbi:hypothetical protein JOL62DRAFT_417883 [Phyllosticta paracitricarpa]